MSDGILHHFKIKGTTPAGYNTEILMDDKPLKGVTGINLIIGVEEANQITIEFIPRKVDLEVDATVIALQKERIFNVEEKEEERKTVKDFEAGD